PVRGGEVAGEAAEYRAAEGEDADHPGLSPAVAEGAEEVLRGHVEHHEGEEELGRPEMDGIEELAGGRDVVPVRSEESHDDSARDEHRQGAEGQDAEEVGHGVEIDR